MRRLAFIGLLLAATASGQGFGPGSSVTTGGCGWVACPSAANDGAVLTYSSATRKGTWKTVQESIGNALTINAASGFTGDLINAALDGSEKFSVNYAGVGEFTGGIIVPQTTKTRYLASNNTSRPLIAGNDDRSTQDVFSIQVGGGALTHDMGITGAVQLLNDYRIAGNAGVTDLQIARWDVSGTSSYGTGSQRYISAGYMQQATGGTLYTTHRERWGVDDDGCTRIVSGAGGEWFQCYASETITLDTGGLTTDSTANLLPANSYIDAVTARVTTAITTTTSWALGDASDADRFLSATTDLTAGTVKVGLNAAAAGLAQAAAAKLRVTCAGSNPGAGAIAVDVWYRQFRAPATMLLTDGDSKTDRHGWQRRLVDLLSAADDEPWRELPTLGLAGYTVATLKAIVDARLAAWAFETPDFILFNCGVNDMGGVGGVLPDAAVWKGNLAYILDAYHVKWPATQVYIAKPCKRDKTTQCDTLAGWVDDVIADGRSAWCHVGIDERGATGLENGDDYVTYTWDGVHYNAAGNEWVAQAWLTVLGF